MGPRGPIGKTGLRGAQGPSGARGAAGAVGKMGPQGLQGREPAWRKHLLEEVQEQIDRIDQELGVQLRRMAQIQREVDELKAKLRKLAGGVDAD